ncbi:MAG: hypothetical protein R2939_13030 [Kofleriaceae bacterium]
MTRERVGLAGSAATGSAASAAATGAGAAGGWLDGARGASAATEAGVGAGRGRRRGGHLGRRRLDHRGRATTHDRGRGRRDRRGHGRLGVIGLCWSAGLYGAAERLGLHRLVAAAILLEGALDAIDVVGRERGHVVVHLESEARILASRSLLGMPTSLAISYTRIVGSRLRGSSVGR